MEEYKIVVVGGGSVDPTIDETYRKQVLVDDKPCVLDILDTGGQEDYSLIRSHYIDSGDGFLIIYSIIDRESFEEINEIVELIRRVKDSETFPGQLCGNKCDLEKDRTVTQVEGYELAQSLELSFYETSAKTTRNLEKSFHHLVRTIRKMKKPTTRKKNKCSIL
ncbi:ras gtpase-related [Anaeramoeba flamelloides]|uniref:Ras gtpase-related n=1 Tax=Anaeramoeba flamelloides TaxID=1746091 RepID=A0ABQ8ZF68_9EUKA|nr:ras gtpase-related [Anaeramoeba flamelloides]